MPRRNSKHSFSKKALKESIDLPLDDAPMVESYYLFVEGEEGTYVRDQGFSVPKDGDKELFKKGNKFDYCSLSSPAGGRYSRTYIRNCPPEDIRDKKVHAWFKFSEVPPGSTYKAFLASLALFALMVILGWALNNDVIDTKDVLNDIKKLVANIKDGEGNAVAASIAALLLLFPGAVAAYVGVELPTGRMLNKEIDGIHPARCSLSVTTIASPPLIAGAPN